MSEISIGRRRVAIEQGRYQAAPDAFSVLGPRRVSRPVRDFQAALMMAYRRLGL